MLWPGLANGLPEVGLVPWGSSLFCVGGENDVSSAITEKALFFVPLPLMCWQGHLLSCDIFALSLGMIISWLHPVCRSRICCATNIMLYRSSTHVCPCSFCQRNNKTKLTQKTHPRCLFVAVPSSPCSCSSS